MAMLEVKDLQVYYGVIQALKGISFEVNQGEVIALIGANGAGKTTTLQTLTGILPAKAGSIMFEGTDLLKVPAHKIVQMGMAHVPEGRRVFADMTVYENLLMGAYTRKDKNEIAQSLEMVYKRFPRLKERQGQRSGTLSGGEQQMLAMGRALMSKPRIILMDEPSMGLSPIFVNEIFDIIKEVSESGTTVLLVEQNAKKLFPLQTELMYWKQEVLLWKERRMTCFTTRQYRRLIWENKTALKAVGMLQGGTRMDEHIVISIARQYGSGGRTVGKMLAEKLGISFYDKEIIRMASDESGIDLGLFGKVEGGNK